MAVSKWLIPLSAAVFTACASPKPLIVEAFMLRDQADNMENIEPMIRNEKLRRLHGAVSMEERRQRLGQYYTIRWHDTDIAKGPAIITFEYQQGATASLIKSYRQEFPADATTGVAEFAVIGDNYFQGGKVLAWRTTLRRGGETIATRRSYLWQ